MMTPARIASRPVEVVAWWAVLTCTWMVTTTSLSRLELLVGATAALPCAVCAVLARHASGVRWSLDPRWVGWLAMLPVTMVEDLPRVARLLLPGPHPSELRELPMPAEEPRARSVTRRALAALLVSATPGSYLVDSPQRRSVLLVHAIGPPSRLERAVTR
jgi:multisubunit Na+/H+ antiporter MnhE subunit